jgi:hypothetical protein
MVAGSPWQVIPGDGDGPGGPGGSGPGGSSSVGVEVLLVLPPARQNQRLY